MTSLQQFRITLTAALLAYGCSAFAQESAPPLGLSGQVGVAAVSTSTYLGSPNRVTVPAPDLGLSYRTRDWGHIDLDGRSGLSWNAEVGAFWGGVLLGVDPGRKERQPSGGFPVPGDARLKGMGDIRSSAQVGAMAGYGPVGAMVLKSVGSRGSEGAQFSLLARHAMPVGDRLTVTVDASATWADRKMMQAYFGVTPTQSAASGFAAYAPKSGLEKADLALGAEYKITDHWTVKGNIGATRLLGDARHSPIVSKPTVATVGAGVAYQF